MVKVSSSVYWPLFVFSPQAQQEEKSAEYAAFIDVQEGRGKQQGLQLASLNPTHFKPTEKAWLTLQRHCKLGMIIHFGAREAVFPMHPSGDCQTFLSKEMARGMAAETHAAVYLTKCST